MATFEFRTYALQDANMYKPYKQSFPNDTVDPSERGWDEDAVRAVLEKKGYTTQNINTQSCVNDIKSDDVPEEVRVKLRKEIRDNFQSDELEEIYTNAEEGEIAGDPNIEPLYIMTIDGSPDILAWEEDTPADSILFVEAKVGKGNYSNSRTVQENQLIWCLQFGTIFNHFVTYVEENPND